MLVLSAHAPLEIAPQTFPQLLFQFLSKWREQQLSGSDGPSEAGVAINARSDQIKSSLVSLVKHQIKLDTSHANYSNRKQMSKNSLMDAREKKKSPVTNVT